MTDTNTLLDFRLRRAPKPHIPAHNRIHQNISDDIIRELTYIHYLWSGVSVIRPKAGKLLEFRLALSDNQDLAGHEILKRFEHLVVASMESLGVEIQWDSNRDNNGYPGFYFYIGTSDATRMVSKKAQKEKNDARSV